VSPPPHTHTHGVSDDGALSKIASSSGTRTGLGWGEDKVAFSIIRQKSNHANSCVSSPAPGTPRSLYSPRPGVHCARRRHRHCETNAIVRVGHEHNIRAKVYRSIIYNTIVPWRFLPKETSAVCPRSNITYEFLAAEWYIRPGRPSSSYTRAAYATRLPSEHRRARVCHNVRRSHIRIEKSKIRRRLGRRATASPLPPSDRIYDASQGFALLFYPSAKSFFLRSEAMSVDRRERKPTVERVSTDMRRTK